MAPDITEVVVRPVKRRGKYLRSAAAAIVCAATAMTAGQMASAAPGSPTARHGYMSQGIPGVSPHDMAIMRAQVPLDQAAVQVSALARSLPPRPASGLAGTWVSGATRTLTIYWKGPVPGRIRLLIARLVSPAVRIRLVSARYTQTELENSAAAVSRAGGVWAVSIRPGADGLVAWLKPGAQVTLGALRVPAAGIPVTISRFASPHRAALNGGRARAALPTSGRLADPAPHWAGARMEGQQQAGVSTDFSECTSGFPMARNSDGRTFITTANHCFGWILNISGRNVESWWSPGYGSSTDPNVNQGFKFGDTWYSYPDLDTKIIRSTSVQGMTYDGGVRPGTEFHKPVVGTASNGGGDSVCESGAASGAFCGITIVPATSTVNGVTVHGWLGTGSATVTDVNGQRQTMAGCGGDSGGPIFSLNWPNSGQVRARGLVSQGNGNQFDWINNNNEEYTDCQPQVFYVDIQDVLNRLGAHIITF